MAGLGVFVGLALAYRGFFPEKIRRQRRCPKCWFDMRATEGLQCTECGHTARKERHLTRRRRIWPMFIAGLLLATVTGLWRPAVDVYTRGWGAVIPTTGLIAIMEKTKAADVLREREPSAWQMRWLMSRAETFEADDQRRAAKVIADSDTDGMVEEVLTRAASPNATRRAVALTVMRHMYRIEPEERTAFVDVALEALDDDVAAVVAAAAGVINTHATGHVDAGRIDTIRDTLLAHEHPFVRAAGVAFLFDQSPRGAADMTAPDTPSIALRAFRTETDPKVGGELLRAVAKLPPSQRVEVADEVWHHAIELGLNEPLWYLRGWPITEAIGEELAAAHPMPSEAQAHILGRSLSAERLGELKFSWQMLRSVVYNERPELARFVLSIGPEMLEKSAINTHAELHDVEVARSVTLRVHAGTYRFARAAYDPGGLTVNEPRVPLGSITEYVTLLGYGPWLLTHGRDWDVTLGNLWPDDIDRLHADYRERSVLDFMQGAVGVPLPDRTAPVDGVDPVSARRAAALTMLTQPGDREQSVTGDRLVASVMMESISGQTFDSIAASSHAIGLPLRPGIHPVDAPLEGMMMTIHDAAQLAAAIESGLEHTEDRGGTSHRWVGSTGIDLPLMTIETNDGPWTALIGRTDDTTLVMTVKPHVAAVAATGDADACDAAIAEALVILGNSVFDRRR